MVNLNNVRAGSKTIVAGISEISLERVRRRLLGLQDRSFKINSIRAFGSRTKGTYRADSDVDMLLISHEAPAMRKSLRIDKIIQEIRKDFLKETGVKLDMNIHSPLEIRSKTKFKASDLKDF